METKRWEEIRRTPPEKLAEHKKWGPYSVDGATLGELRKLVGKTQEEVGEVMGVSGVEVGRFEARRDVQVAFLRRYLAALGGELDLYARFDEKIVPLKGLDLVAPPKPPPTPEEVEDFRRRARKAIRGKMRRKAGR
jgi:transcriptional regulator with XRE-family HTH domain